MASSSSSKNVTIYTVDNEEPIIIDDSEFVSEPDMTSVEDNIWGEELMIPHKLGDQPTINVEAPSTGGPAPILEKINPSLQDPSDQDGNEGNATILVNDEDSLAQDVGTNNVEVTLAGKDKGPEIEEIPTNHPDSEKTISAHAAESTHSSENTDVEMESDNQDDSMPEATEGGSEILQVSSTSKLSADIGLSEI
ncbi:hypothetical protein P8452_32786 [Trifolium repens]|nr:hypothetical protein P8452_32786 [Trifolium repens]